jgi:hypothetical protein
MCLKSYQLKSIYSNYKAMYCERLGRIVLLVAHDELGLDCTTAAGHLRARILNF